MAFILEEVIGPAHVVIDTDPFKVVGKKGGSDDELSPEAVIMIASYGVGMFPARVCFDFSNGQIRDRQSLGGRRRVFRWSAAWHWPRGGASGPPRAPRRHTPPGTGRRAQGWHWRVALARDELSHASASKPMFGAEADLVETESARAIGWDLEFHAVNFATFRNPVQRGKSRNVECPRRSNPHGQGTCAVQFSRPKVGLLSVLQIQIPRIPQRPHFERNRRV